ISERSSIAALTASGTYTVPAGMKQFDVYAISGGCGGGSGSTSAPGISTFGGGGGACGAATWHRLQASDITDAALIVTVGSGGAGGAAVSARSTPGHNGANGGDSKVVGATSGRVFAFATAANADYITTLGGGRGGSTGSGAAGIAQGGTPWTTVGGPGASSIGSAAGNSSRGNTPGSGGAGGGISKTPAWFAGGAAYVPYGRNDLFPATTK